MVSVAISQGPGPAALRSARSPQQPMPHRSSPPLRACFSVTRLTHRDEIWPLSVPSPWSLHRTRGLYTDFRQQVTVPWCGLLVGKTAWGITAKLATDGRDRQMRTSDRMGYGQPCAPIRSFAVQAPCRRSLRSTHLPARSTGIKWPVFGGRRTPRQAGIGPSSAPLAMRGMRAVNGPKASPIFPVGFECGDLPPPKRFAWHGGSFKLYSGPDRGLFGQSPINKTASPPRPKHPFSGRL